MSTYSMDSLESTRRQFLRLQTRLQIISFIAVLLAFFGCILITQFLEPTVTNIWLLFLCVITGLNGFVFLLHFWWANTIQKELLSPFALLRIFLSQSTSILGIGIIWAMYITQMLNWVSFGIFILIFIGYHFSLRSMGF